MIAGIAHLHMGLGDGLTHFFDDGACSVEYLLAGLIDLFARWHSGGHVIARHRPHREGHRMRLGRMDQMQI